MSILIFADQHAGKITKSSLEAVTYGSALAAQMGTTATALVTGSITSDGGLGAAGATKVLHLAEINTSDSQQLTLQVNWLPLVLQRVWMPV
jgi:electron transfer flavoprotein alpha subunit